MLDRLRHHTSKATSHSESAEEHAAFVDLVVLAIYADRRVSQAELDALESFDANHASWDGDGFNLSAYMGEATAKVRHAIQSPEATRSLIADAGHRITTPSLREEAVRSFAAVLEHDGTTDAERELLAEVAATLRSS